MCRVKRGAYFALFRMSWVSTRVKILLPLEFWSSHPSVFKQNFEVRLDPAQPCFGSSRKSLSYQKDRLRSAENPCIGIRLTVGLADDKVRATCHPTGQDCSAGWQRTLTTYSDVCGPSICPEESSAFRIDCWVLASRNIRSRSTV